jgi:hypothetical protein
MNDHMLIAVGERHPLAAIIALNDGMRAAYHPSGINLIIVMDPLSEADVKSFREDGMKFGLIRLRGGYAWLLRTGIATLDAPYSPLIEAAGQRHLPWRTDDTTPESRAAVHLHLIDGKGIARALKMVTVSPQFTRMLERLHFEAQETAIDPALWNAEIAKFSQRFPTPNAALKAAVVVCKGGD